MDGGPMNCTLDSCNVESMCPGDNCTLPTLQPEVPYVTFRDQSRFCVQRVLVPIITVVGVIGNTVTIVVMSRRRMRSSTNYYLAALAVVDMLYLVFSFILSLSHYPNIHDVKYYGYWRFRPYALMLTDLFSNTSVWLTVAFTVERYIAVCHPIRGKVFCTESRARNVIIGIFLACLTITLPTPFEYRVVETTKAETNTTEVDLAASALGSNDLYLSIYENVVSITFMFLPFILLAVFNSFLIRSLHISKVRRKTMIRRSDTRDSSRQERKITIMLVAVVILFFVCQLPTAMLMNYKRIHAIKKNEANLITGLGNLFNFLVAINAAGNFVLYCMFSQKYRTTFLQTFCPCLKGKIYHLHSVYQSTVFTSMTRDSPRARVKSRAMYSTTEENGRIDTGQRLTEFPDGARNNARKVSFSEEQRNSDCPV